MGYLIKSKASLHPIASQVKIWAVQDFIHGGGGGVLSSHISGHGNNSRRVLFFLSQGGWDSAGGGFCGKESPA